MGDDDGFRIIIGIGAGFLLLWLGGSLLGSYLQFGMQFGWWIIGLVSVVFILGAVFYTAFWGR
jgi:hypothetical protein